MSTLTAEDPAFESAYLARYEEARERSAALVGRSLADRFAELPIVEQDKILTVLPKKDRAALLYSWLFWSREKQRVPDIAHRIVLWLGGRGFGKTRNATERVRQRIYEGAKAIVLIGPTKTEVLRYMVGGKRGARRNGSGLLDIFPPHERREIELKQEKLEIHFHFTGAIVHLVSDEQPELRGGAYEVAWLDEIIKWRHLARLWDNLEFTMREQSDVETEVIVTTTPKPIRFLKELIVDPDTITVTGKTDENASNLASSYTKRLDRKFGGSRIERQERGGEMLNDNEGALFNATNIERYRVLEAPVLVRIVISIDPAIATNNDNDDTGIAAVGIDARGHLYVLADGSGKHTPEEWGTKSLTMHDQWKADAFVGERNRGGDLVAANMRATVRLTRGPHAVVKIIEVHATRNKIIRAEPVSTLADQGRLHFVGVHQQMEEEITTWDSRVGGKSPNRLDALVWAVYELAKLSVESEPDNSAGFVGITEAAEALRSGETVLSNLTALLARGPRSTI